MRRLVVLTFALVFVVRSRTADAQSASGQSSSVTAYDSALNGALRQALAVSGARLEYQWVVKSSRADKRDGLVVFDPGSRDSLKLDSATWLNLEGVRSVQASYSSSGAVVFVTLKPDVASRLRSSIAHHRKDRLAVFINGRFVTAPIINSPIASSLPVVIDADSTLAARLVERLLAQLAHD